MLAVIYETLLLIDPIPTTACHLLASYARQGYIFTFLTPQWAYKAGLILLKSQAQLEKELIIEGYSNCMKIFERCSRDWPGSKGLRCIIQSYLEWGKLSRAQGKIP